MGRGRQLQVKGDGESDAPEGGAGGTVPPMDKGKVRVHLVWEGSFGEARRFGEFTKRLISDLDDDPDRKHALRLRKLWREATEEAGVRDG